MIRILFICHGNICRSPMAEYIFNDLISKHSLSVSICAESAATSSEELGNPVYPPAKRELSMHGISCDGKTARQVTEYDYENFDYLIIMEKYNLKRLCSRLGKYSSDPDGKISLLLDYTDHPGDISDPWYSGNFRETYDEILCGCRGLMEKLLSHDTGEMR